MNTLNPGDRLEVNQELRSDNGLYVLIMQGDGNLVLYEGVATPPWRAVWATNTWNLPPARRPIRADMQQDGNFVLYSATGPEWASGTQMYPESRLILQDDRNLVIYDRNNTAWWASNTAMAQQPPPAEPPRPTAPLEAETEWQNIGWGKSMHTKATQYRDGRLQLRTSTKNDNWTGGLRGRVLVIVVDAAGRAICVSEDHACTTRCSVPDVSCASNGTDLFTDTFPEAIGRYATRLDIYQAETPSFVDLRAKTIEGIKAVKDIVDVAADLKAAIALLFG
jgi:hypothetical protein